MGRVIALSIAFIFLVTAVFPVGQWAIAPLENKYVTMLPGHVDGILLLTGDENPLISQARGMPVGGHAAQRYLYAARLLQQYPKAKLVVVGRTGPEVPHGRYPTQAIAAQFFKDMGLTPSRVHYEPNSRTTHENAVFSKKLIKPQKGQKWILLTSAYHLPRAFLAFEKEGWQVLPVASDFFTDGATHFMPTFNLAHQFRLIHMAAHEYVGLVGYWGMGWSQKPW